MKYPALVRDKHCQTNMKVTIYSQDVGEDGEPIILFSKELKCNYNSEKSSRHYDKERNYIETRGVALFNGDIFPEVNEVTVGEVEVYGEKRKIYSGTKARNPDGTVNYTKLELI